MPPKLTTKHVEKYLQENGCELLSEYINSKTKIIILCKCGHERTTLLSHIKIWQQFLCKECTVNIHFKSNLKECIHPKTFQKMQRIMKTKIKNSLKYRNDFDPENINKKLLCIKCNIEKSNYLFFNNKANKSGKVSYCKLCHNEQDKIKRENSTVDQRIKILLNAANISFRNERVTEFNIDLQYLLQLKDNQENKCIYTGNQLIWKTNDLNTASLDRIDSLKGYVKGNVQFVSKCINPAKSDLTEQEFFKIVQQIYRFQYFNYTLKEINVEQAKSHIRKLLKTCKGSIKTRKDQDRNKCLEYDLTVDFILELAEKQCNRCAYTGKELIWLTKNNYSTSIDRRDTLKIMYS